MAHPFDYRLDAIADRIDRAEEHIGALKVALRAYFESDAYEFRGDYDAYSNEFPITGRAQMVEPRICTLAGEVLHNLRSALDHLAWELVRANSGQPDENTSFPILHVGPTPNKKGIQPPPYISGGVSAAAQVIVGDAQPYKLGTAYAGHPLWPLQRINIVDKHRHVAIEGLFLTNTSFMPSDFEDCTWTAQREHVDEYGAQLAMVPDDPSVNMQGSSTLQVVIHEPADGIQGRPLLRSLEDALATVREIFNAARANCFP